MSTVFIKSLHRRRVESGVEDGETITSLRTRAALYWVFVVALPHVLCVALEH